MTRPTLPCRAALLAAALASGAASAHPPSGASVALEPAYAYAVDDGGQRPAGGGGGVALRIPLGEAFSVVAQGGYSAHDIDARRGRPGGVLHVVRAAAGLAYALDSVPLSPAIEATAGAILRWAPGEDRRADAALGVALSFEHTLLPWLAVGGVVRYHAVITDLGRFPVLVEVGPRVTLLWP